MSIIEHTSDILAQKICTSLGYSNEQKAVIAYGIFNFLYTLVSWSIVLLLGLLLGIFIPTATLLFTAVILRNFSGGAHCTSPSRCAVTGALTFLTLAFLVTQFSMATPPASHIIYIMVCFATAGFILYRLSPVDSPNKPIRRAETRKRLRRRTFVFFALCIILAAFMSSFDTVGNFIDTSLITLSIATGLIWQSLSLLAVGHRLIAKFDHVLSYIIK